MNWTADDGTIIHYETHGDARRPALLLLPGLLGSISKQWQSFIEPLVGHYFVVLMDLRGHGRSENKEPSLETGRMVQDIVGLLDHLEITAVRISGYSLGGYLGMQLAISHPRRVATLHTHATKFYWTSDAVAKMQKQLDPDKMAEKVPAYANQLVLEHGGRRWRELVRQAADLVASLEQNGLTEQNVQQIRCPTLISVGDRDEVVGIGEALSVSRLFDRGGLLVLPGVRHPIHTLSLIPLLPMLQSFHKNR
ncbi:MAG: alpha/beta hydrolase [Chloroflexota bacterium]